MAARRCLRGRLWPVLAGLIVAVAVVMRMLSGIGTALTGRIGRDSTARLAVVAAASLLVTELGKSIGRGHPQLRDEWGVVRHPV